MSLSLLSYYHLTYVPEVFFSTKNSGPEASVLFPRGGSCHAVSPESITHISASYSLRQVCPWSLSSAYLRSAGDRRPLYPRVCLRRTTTFVRKKRVFFSQTVVLGKVRLFLDLCHKVDYAVYFNTVQGIPLTMSIHTCFFSKQRHQLYYDLRHVRHDFMASLHTPRMRLFSAYY